MTNFGAFESDSADSGGSASDSRFINTSSIPSSSGASFNSETATSFTRFFHSASQVGNGAKRIYGDAFSCKTGPANMESPESLPSPLSKEWKEEARRVSHSELFALFKVISIEKY